MAVLRRQLQIVVIIIIIIIIYFFYPRKIIIIIIIIIVIIINSTFKGRNWLVSYEESDSRGIHVQAGSQSYASHCVSVRLFPTCISLV